MLFRSQAPPLLSDDLDGAPARWPEPGATSRLLLAFIRPATSPHGREALSELAEAVPRFQAVNVPIWVVCPSAPSALRGPCLGSGLRLLPDADGAVAATWGMGRDPLGLLSLRGLLDPQVPLGRALRALGRGGRLGALLHPALPAELLLEPDGRIRWIHLACSRWAPPDLAGALAAAR